MFTDQEWTFLHRDFFLPDLFLLCIVFVCSLWCIVLLWYVISCKLCILHCLNVYFCITCHRTQYILYYSMQKGNEMKTAGDEWMWHVQLHYDRQLQKFLVFPVDICSWLLKYCVTGSVLLQKGVNDHFLAKLYITLFFIRVTKELIILYYTQSLEV